MLLRRQPSKGFLSWLCSDDSQVSSRAIATERRDKRFGFEFDTGAPALDQIRHEIDAGHAADFTIGLDRPADRELAPSERSAITNIGTGILVLFKTKRTTPSLALRRLNIRRLTVLCDQGDAELSFADCWVDHIEILAATKNSGLNVTFENTWVGFLKLESEAVLTLKMARGGVLAVGSPPSNQVGPFRGAVSFQGVFLPRADRAYKGESHGHLPWTSLRNHLAAIGNLAAAGQVHSVELAIERPEQPLATRTVSWLYQIGSDCGNSIGRPIAIILLLWAGVFAAILLSDGASQALDANRYEHWKVALTQDGWAPRVLRSLLLSVDPITNPLGLLKRDSLFEPRFFWLAAIQFVQSFLSGGLLFLAVLAIRRRFKIT